MGKQGDNIQTTEDLSEIYNWFTGGVETADLKEAKVLLEELGG